MQARCSIRATEADNSDSPRVRQRCWQACPLKWRSSTEIFSSRVANAGIFPKIQRGRRNKGKLYGNQPGACKGSEMYKLRKVLTIACVTPLIAMGVAACGGQETSGGGGGGGGGGDITVTMSSFPDYVDPQLSYTVEGWETL